jgi:hypothetical protein
MWLIAVIWSESYLPLNYQNNKTCQDLSKDSKKIAPLKIESRNGAIIHQSAL